MGSLYYRKDADRTESIWFNYYDVMGERVREPSGYKRGQEKEAKKCLALMEDRIKAEREHGVTVETGPLTVRLYGERWVKERKQRIETANDDESRLTHHVYPTLGDMAIADVKPRHIRDLLRHLGRKKSDRGKPLAPKTIHNIYGALHRLMHDAQVDELIEANPCVLKKGDLPKKVDADPAWRASAVFTREEVEVIISHPSIPDDRRVLYALFFLGGMRFGEAAALQWRDLDVTRQPLGCLLINKSYSTKKRKVKSTKTGTVRQMPVHPTFARILASWKSEGWAQTFGRKPTDADLIVPSRNKLRHRSSKLSLTRFHEDLERIGLRARRQHDGRRTFISLARADGAAKDVLAWSTHAPAKEQIDLYTTFPWAALSAPVAGTKIRLLDAAALAHHMAGLLRAGIAVTGAVTGFSVQSETPDSTRESGVSVLRGGRDSKTRSSRILANPRGSMDARSRTCPLFPLHQLTPRTRLPILGVAT